MAVRPIRWISEQFQPVALATGAASPADGSWDDVVITRSNSVSVTGLPSGYKVRVGDLISAPASGNAVMLNLQHLKFPVAKLTVLDGNNVIVQEFVPSDGIWGGDEFALAPVS